MTIGMNGPQGNEWNTYTTQPNGSSGGTDQILAWLQWDSDASTNHYDLFVYDVTGTVVLDSSTNTGSFESISWTNGGMNNTIVQVMVRGNTNNPPEFELFVHPNQLGNQVAASSIECPANTTASNVISVGAVHRNNYNDAPGTDPITSYSSHGPSNSGNQAPDLCAVTSSTTNAYEGNFSGTSCSAPNAAGAAAALWSALPNYSATGIRQLLLRKAFLYKDWGDAGVDMIYGYGGLYLKDYTANTIYVLKTSGNSSGTNTRPYSSIQQADTYGNSGYNAFILGHVHEQPPADTILNKPMIYRSVVNDAVIK